MYFTQLCTFLFLPSHNKLMYCGGEVENFDNFVNLGIRVYHHTLFHILYPNFYTYNPKGQRHQYIWIVKTLVQQGL
jgi:hypothetical protein